jgi:para-aminobenzoate synthetase
MRRSADPKVDHLTQLDLARDEKSRAENLMIVDLVRNDLGRVARVGSVHVPGLMSVESFKTVHHLVSTIRAQLRPQFSIVDAIVATFPGGSMTGAPKLRTMGIIEDEEKRGRGVYSGAIGYISRSGASDLNIAIRTAVIAGDDITVSSGGAIIALSDPAAEVDEAVLKAQAELLAHRLLGIDPGDVDREIHQPVGEHHVIHRQAGGHQLMPIPREHLEPLRQPGQVPVQLLLRRRVGVFQCQC